MENIIKRTFSLRDNSLTPPIYVDLAQHPKNGVDDAVSHRKHSFLFIPLKSQFFISPKLEGMGGNEIKFNNFFTKTPKIPLYIQTFILK